MLQSTGASLISTSVEAILYGVSGSSTLLAVIDLSQNRSGFSVFMYIVTFWIVRRNDHKQYPKRVYLIVTLLLFVLATAVS